jgi:hypothetical protein
MGRVRNIIFFCLLLVGFVGLANLCRADSKSPPEFRAVNNIAGSITLNLETNNNASLNWQQVARYTDINKWNRELSQPGNIFVLQEHYVFVTNKWIISQARNRQVILIRTVPRTSYEGREGRYLVSWNGRYAETVWTSETDFEEHLKQSGITLPVPDPAEVAAAKAAVERLITREQIEHQMIVAAAPKPTWADIGAVWWIRIKSWLFVYTENGHFTGRPRPFGIFVGLGLLALVIYGWRWVFKYKVPSKTDGLNGFNPKTK